MVYFDTILTSILPRENLCLDLCLGRPKWTNDLKITVVSFCLDMLNFNYLIRQKLSLEKQRVNFPTVLSTILGQIKLDINVAWLSWSSRHKFQSCQNQAEYNVEFQGSMWNLQKRTLFMKFYPEMP